jgi:hypothetical protein
VLSEGHVKGRVLFLQNLDVSLNTMRRLRICTLYKILLKVKVKQSRYRPGVPQRVQEVKVPRLHDSGTGWW